MRKIVFFAATGSILPFILFSMLGCSKQLNEPDTKTVITSIFPTTAKHGDIITVYGRNLLRDSAGFSITINSIEAPINQYTNDSVKATVPEKAGSGTVAITYGNRTINGPEFSYQFEAIVTTIAGSGIVGTSDGQGDAASFNCPWGIVADDNGDLYIADTYNRLIRKITASNNNAVSTISIPIYVGSSTFYSPYNIAIDKNSKSLYVTDFNEHLMKISAAGDMSVILTDSMPLAGIAVGPNSKLYLDNNTTGEIFELDTTGQNKITYASGIVTPRNIIFDKDNVMYVAGYGIYKMNGPNNFSFIIDGSHFNGWEIAVDSSGNFYEADHFNNRIRKIDKGGNITVIAGSGDAADVDGTGLNASFNGPQGITIDKEGNLYVTTFNYDTNGGNKVRKVTFR